VVRLPVVTVAVAVLDRVESVASTTAEERAAATPLRDGGCLSTVSCRPSG